MLDVLIQSTSTLHRYDCRWTHGGVESFFIMPEDLDEPIPDLVEHPIGPELDLHTFRPGEIGSLLPEYFAECRRLGIFRVRIIHGKGSGTLRTGVHQLLARLPEVKQFIWPADEWSGSWGATWVILQA